MEKYQMKKKSLIKWLIQKWMIKEKESNFLKMILRGKKYKKQKNKLELIQKVEEEIKNDLTIF